MGLEVLEGIGVDSFLGTGIIDQGQVVLVFLGTQFLFVVFISEFLENLFGGTVGFLGGVDMFEYFVGNSPALHSAFTLIDR